MSDREKFEAWALSQGHKICRHHIDHNDYADTYTFFMWNAYQAATAEQDKTIAELNAKLAEQIEINSTLAERLNANTVPLDVVAENLELNARIAELESWQDYAFTAHPNIDLDIEAVAKAKQVKE